MKTEVKTPIIIVAVVALVGLIAFLGMKFAGGGGDLDQGQVKYTPGKPPWEESDPNKKGPGAQPSGAPAPNGQTGGPGVPPGVGAPVIGNGG